jgi:hypothetical protein
VLEAFTAGATNLDLTGAGSDSGTRRMRGEV